MKVGTTVGGPLAGVARTPFRGTVPVFCVPRVHREAGHTFYCHVALLPTKEFLALPEKEQLAMAESAELQAELALSIQVQRMRKGAL